MRYVGSRVVSKNNEKEQLVFDEELLQGEMLRWKLVNTIQDLKGNICVFCRVKPLLAACFQKTIEGPVGPVRRDRKRSGKRDIDKKKHDIKHEGRFTKVTDVVVGTS